MSNDIVEDLQNTGQPKIPGYTPPTVPTVSQQLEGLLFDDKPFTKTINYFQYVAPDAEILTGEEIVSILKSQFSFELFPKETKALEAIVDLLPDSMRRGTRGENPQTIVSFVNLLPLIRAAQTEMNKNAGGADARSQATYVARLEAIRTKVLEAYKNNERDNYLASVSPEDMQNVSPEEIEKRLGDYVEGPNYRTPPAQQAELAPVADQSTTPGLDVGEASVGIESFGPSAPGAEYTMENILRNNPDSTIYNLIELEKTTGLFSDGFENSYFNQLTRGDWITEKDDQGNVKAVSAEQALNLIYELQEKGDKTRILEIQRMLTEAGYFQVLETTYREGEADEATVQAWALFLTESAKRDMVPSKLFVEKKQQWENTRRYGAGMIRPDPNTVFNLLDQIGVEVLGRGLTLPERQELYGKFNEWDRQRVTNLTQPGGMPTAVDLESRVSSYLRNQNETELEYTKLQNLQSNLTKWFGE